MPFSKSAPLSLLIALITYIGGAKRIRFVFLTLFFAVVLSSLPVHLKHDGAIAQSRRSQLTQVGASYNPPKLGEIYGNAASGSSRKEYGYRRGLSPLAAQSGGVVTVYPSAYQSPSGGGEAVNSQTNRGHGSTTSSRTLNNANASAWQTKTALWSGFQNVTGPKVRVTLKFDWSFDANVEACIGDSTGIGTAYARLDVNYSTDNGGNWSSAMVPHHLEVNAFGEECWSDSTSRGGSVSINLPNPGSINITQVKMQDYIHAEVETSAPSPAGSNASASATVTISNISLEVETVNCIDSVPVNQWRGEYYNNTGLSGAPAMVQNDGAGFLNFNFGDGGPGSPCIPVTDNFSARWKRTVNFEAGTYRFTATADDGVRLYVDGQLKIDQWTPHAPTTYTADVFLSAGDHEIKLEYFEGVGGAVAILTWAPVCQTTVAANRWKGEYFNNQAVAGSPAVTRDDGPDSLNLNFGGGSPWSACGVIADNFSARWTRTVNFAQGIYRFSATVDNGVRLYVDGYLRIDQWANLPPNTYTADVFLSAGDHQIKLEFIEYTGGASVALSWTAVSGVNCFANVPPDRWKGEYYSNTNLSGSPALTRDDGPDFLNLNFGAASPSSACGLGADYFSARWTRTVNFAAGTYRFTATADSGVRLYVDGQLKIDQWAELPLGTYTADVPLTAGDHQIKLEFFETFGNASASLSWIDLPCFANPPADRWKGEYYNNNNLAGAPAMVSDHGAGFLNLNFGSGSPSSACGLGADNFSARWTRTINFAAGTYRFYATVDNGARLYVDGQLKIDQWGNLPPNTYTADVSLTAGNHVIKLEFVEYAGGASANLFWTSTTAADLNMALIDPINSIGSPGENLLSRNCNWSLPLLALPGRAGMDLGLALSLNSLVYTRAGSVMHFDPDQGNPAPGFRLGFPEIRNAFFNTSAGAPSYLLSMPSGSRVEFRQINMNVYEAIDSSYMLLTHDPVNSVFVLYTTDGTQCKFVDVTGLGDYKCVQIKDRNGNFITIGYGSLAEIRTIIDTAGREINFNYDEFNHLLSITQNWGGQTHTWATFAYGTQTIQTNFPGLTLNGTTNGAQESVLTRVGLADGSVYSFEYNTYAQVKTIRRYAPNNSDPVNFPNDYFQRAYTTYGLPDNANDPQTDCPRITSRTDWAYDWNPGVTSVYAADPGYAWGQVTFPDGTIYKEIFATTGWQRGLTTQTENWSGGVKKKWTTLHWTQDNTGVAYRLNPRVTETNVYDEEGNRRKKTTSYTSFGLVSDVYEYDTNATTVLRRMHTDYNLSAIYTSRRIIGLPSAQYLYDGADTLFSKVTFEYDQNPDPYLQHQGPPVQHDTANYGTDFVQGRGNLNVTRRWDMTDPDEASLASESETGYNTSGSVIFTRDPLDHQASFSYADSFSDGQNDRNTYAYPTTMTDPDQFSSTIQYNYDHGAVTRTQNPKGAAVTRTYDEAGRIGRITQIVNGAYTRYVYRPDQREVETYTTVNELSPANEFRSVTVFDGRDRVRATASDHPTSAGQYKAQYNVYDVMGRLVEQTNPTEINDSWQAAGDDAEDGWVSSHQSYDWQGRMTLFTDQQGNTKEFLYDGCGCAGGKVVVTRDEMGRRRKITYDVLGRLKTTQALFIQPKNQPLNGDGDVYSMTTNTYNVRDQITNISQRAGLSGPEQNTVMSYDGYGRLLTRQHPIESAPTSFAYNADDTPQMMTDSRGVTTTYGYNDRHLVTSITYGAEPGVVSVSPVTFDYDEAGNRLWMDDGPGRVDYNFDIQSRLQSETREISGVGSYTLTYEYNLAGQLKSVTDPAGSSFSYVFNKAGQITGVDGSGPASIPQYATNIQYRAWGGIKHADYHHGVNMNRTFTARMQPARYELTNVWDNLSFPIPPAGARKMGYDFEYHPDGNLRFAGDLLNNKFDRSYAFDHVGRLQTASTAKGARGEPVGPGDEYQMPYSQTFSYDAFGNTTSRGGFLWHVQRSDSATYNNDRRQGWSYDNSGNVVDDATTGTHTYDCANRQVNFVSKATVGGFATGFPEEPAAEIEMDYDGGGSSVKRIETRREEIFQQPQPPPTSIQTTVTTTYYLRSSILGMAVISEIGDDGLKKVGYVYDPAGERLAIQSSSGSVSWYHFPGGTGSWISTDNETNPFWSHYPTRHGLRTEMDPLGADVGVSDPFPMPLPEYEDRQRPLYEDGGDPFNYSFGCAWGGMPFSCSSSRKFLGDLAGPGFGTPPTFPKNIPSISWGSLGDLIFSKIRPPSIVNVDPRTPGFGGGFGFLPAQQDGGRNGRTDCAWFVDGLVFEANDAMSPRKAIRMKITSSPPSPMLTLGTTLAERALPQIHPENHDQNWTPTGWREIFVQAPQGGAAYSHVYGQAAGIVLHKFPAPYRRGGYGALTGRGVSDAQYEHDRVRLDAATNRLNTAAPGTQEFNDALRNFREREAEVAADEAGREIGEWLRNVIKGNMSSEDFRRKAFNRLCDR
jgi:YD repeat-containing protein